VVEWNRTLSIVQSKSKNQEYSKTGQNRNFLLNIYYINPGLNENIVSRKCYISIVIKCMFFQKSDIFF
jgi:hypothetical protein